MINPMNIYNHFNDQSDKFILTKTVLYEQNRVRVGLHSQHLLVVRPRESVLFDI